jgi:hypothetical protein
LARLARGSAEVATFDSVQRRVRANCYDCAGASEAALRSAVADLDRLVASGFTTMDARRLLADSYRELALTYSDSGSREQRELLSRHREIYSALLADNPDNLDLLLGYARSADDVDAAERLVTKASAALAEAHFIAGALLIAQSRDENERAVARDHLQNAFDLATGAQKVAYGRRFADLLVEIGENQSAERVLNDVEEYQKGVGL